MLNHNISLREKSNLIKFKWLYNIKNLRTKLIIVIFIGAIYSLITTIFIKNTSLYTGGTSAFFFGVARLVQSVMMQGKANEDVVNLVYNLLFWGLYVCMNVPLFFIAYKYVGKQFAIISMTFLLASQVSGFLYGLIPGGIGFSLFGETNNVNEYMHDHYKIDTIVLKPNIFVNLTDPNDKNWTPSAWRMVSSDNYEHQPVSVSTIINSNYVKFLILILYASLFSIVSAIVISAMFILGGSTAGSDFITIWYSIKKHKDVGLMYSLINGAFMFCGSILGNYLPGVIAWNDIKAQTNISTNPFADFSYLMSANLICSILWVFLNGAFIKVFFPSKKIIKCEVASQKISAVYNAVCNSADFSIIPIKYSDVANNTNSKGKATLKFMCSYLEFTYALKTIKEIDPDSLVISEFVHDVDGPAGLYKNNFGK